MSRLRKTSVVRSADTMLEAWISGIQGKAAFSFLLASMMLASDEMTS